MSKFTTPTKKQLKPLSLDWKPHDYQKKAVKFMLENCSAGLFLDPGLGKTSITLAALKILKQKKMFNRALIIAPLRVCYSVWPEEVKKWNDFKHLEVQILHGKDKEKNLGKAADIYLINPEGLNWLFDQKEFKKNKFDVLIIDESSKFKATGTQRFKKLRPILPRFNRRYILTGTPAPNGLLDLFGQIYILDLGAALGAYISHYRTQYFFDAGHGYPDWRILPGAEEQIQEAIRPLTLRLDAEDYLELPELIVNPVFIELEGKAWEAYKEMEDELILAIEKGDIVAVNAAVASGKCAQIANGGIYDEDKKVHHIHDLKAEAVRDIIAELNGTPALVGYEYGHDLDRLKKALGKNTPHIGGGVSTKRSTEIANAWNNYEIPVLLGQPASMAHGLNLQNAGNHVIWHSLPWNFEHYDQFNRRVRRQGSTHDKVFVHHIVAKNTIDELKLHALNRKFRTQKDLFDALRNFLEEKEDFSLYFSDEMEHSENVNDDTTQTSKEEKPMAKFAKKAKTDEKPKAAKKAPAKKAAPKKKAPAKAAAEKETANDNRKIKVLVKENPKREGSASYDRFELYSDCKTVQDFKDAGGTSADLRHDEEKGFIEIK